MVSYVSSATSLPQKQLICVITLYIDCLDPIQFILFIILHTAITLKVERLRVPREKKI